MCHNLTETNIPSALSPSSVTLSNYHCLKKFIHVPMFILWGRVGSVLMYDVPPFSSCALTLNMCCSSTSLSSLLITDSWPVVGSILKGKPVSRMEYLKTTTASDQQDKWLHSWTTAGRGTILYALPDSVRVSGLNSSQYCFFHLLLWNAEVIDGASENRRLIHIRHLDGHLQHITEEKRLDLDMI